MADTKTARGAVWNSALLLATTASRFKIDHVLEHAELTEGQRRTAQRALRELTARGWLSHSPGSPWYSEGTMLREIRDHYLEVIAGDIVQELTERIPENYHALPHQARSASIPFRELEGWRDTLDPEETASRSRTPRV